MRCYLRVLRVLRGEILIIYETQGYEKQFRSEGHAHVEIIDQTNPYVCDVAGASIAGFPGC